MGLSLFARATPTARLVYVRGEGAATCVDEEGLKLAVAKRLGYDPFRVLADNTVSVDVRKQGSRFVARLKLSDHEGRERGVRELASKSDDCADLTDTLALTVSIALDPLSLTRPPPPPPGPVDETATPALPPEPPPAEPTPPPEPPPAKPQSTPSTPRKTSFAVGLGAHATIGAGPSPAFGPDLYVGAQVSAFELQLSGRIDAPSSANISTGGSVSTSLAAASLAPCLRFRWFAFCAQGTLGALTTSSQDVTRPRSDSGVWFALGSRASITVPIAAGFGARIFAELSFPLTPYELRLGGTAVYGSSAVMGSFGVGPSFTFD